MCPRTSRLGNSGHVGNGQGHRHILAGDGASRVGLANLPVGVLPFDFGAVKGKLSSALCVEAATFIQAWPGLVDVEGVVAAAEVEGAFGEGIVGLCAVIVD